MGAAPFSGRLSPMEEPSCKQLPQSQKRMGEDRHQDQGDRGDLPVNRSSC